MRDISGKLGENGKIKYPQPYSIKVNTGNVAYNDKLRERLHHAAKKYAKSKWSKRYFSNED